MRMEQIRVAPRQGIRVLLAPRSRVSEARMRIGGLFVASLAAVQSPSKAAETLDVVGPVQAAAHAPLQELNPFYPAQAVLYGKLSVGYVKTDTKQPYADSSTSGIGSGTRSYWGLRAAETLGNGFFAFGQFEHSLRVSNGETATTGEVVNAASCKETSNGASVGGCFPFWTKTVVGLSRRDLGRLELGRREQPAWLVSLTLDPWDGNTSASPAERLYYPPLRGFVRTSRSATYSSPVQQPFWGEVQVAQSEAGNSSHPNGASVNYLLGGLYAGVGWQHWTPRNMAIPMGVTYDDGSVRYYLALATGRVDGADGVPFRYRTIFAGAALKAMALGDPGRNEWRFGLARFATGTPKSDTKAALGYVYKLSQRTSLQANAAVTWRANDRGTGVDIAIVHAFARDFRGPQPLR